MKRILSLRKTRILTYLISGLQPTKAKAMRHKKMAPRRQLEMVNFQMTVAGATVPGTQRAVQNFSSEPNEL